MISNVDIDNLTTVSVLITASLQVFIFIILYFFSVMTVMTPEKIFVKL